MYPQATPAAGPDCLNSKPKTVVTDKIYLPFASIQVCYPKMAIIHVFGGAREFETLFQQSRGLELGS